MYEKHLETLGFKVRDVITGFSGVVSSISFDLYGCVQAIVTPEYQPGKTESESSRWFDTKRLEKVSKAPVMELPSFATPPGGQSLPAYPTKP